MVSELGPDAQGRQYKRLQHAWGESNSKSCGSTHTIWYYSRRHSMAIAVYTSQLSVHKLFTLLSTIAKLPVPWLSRFLGQCPALCAGCSVSPQKCLSSKFFKSLIHWSFGHKSFHCLVSTTTVLVGTSSTWFISSWQAIDVLVFSYCKCFV